MNLLTSPVSALFSFFRIRRREVVFWDAEALGRVEWGIPLLGEIPAGYGESRFQESEGMVYVDMEAVRLPKGTRVFALRVKGDSMIGKLIQDGDIVVLEQNAEPRNGDVVAALIDGLSTLKTYVTDRGRAFLRAENPRYPNLIPAGELVIQGVMRALVRQPVQKKT